MGVEEVQFFFNVFHLLPFQLEQICRALGPWLLAKGVWPQLTMGFMRTVMFKPPSRHGTHTQQSPAQLGAGMGSIKSCNGGTPKRWNVTQGGSASCIPRRIRAQIPNPCALCRSDTWQWVVPTPPQNFVGRDSDSASGGCGEGKEAASFWAGAKRGF